MVLNNKIVVLTTEKATVKAICAVGIIDRKNKDVTEMLSLNEAMN